MTTETRTLPTQHRQVRLLPKTFNAEERTIEAVWSTGARVRRFDFWKERYYDEELSMDTESIDMTRLESGNAPVLNSHHSWSLESQIGVVERAWVENGEGRATLRLSKRASITDIVGDIESGIIRNLSVGYSVQRFVIEQGADDVPLYRAVAWQPHEISFVALPADAGATTRSKDQASQGLPCEFVRAATAQPTTPEVQTMNQAAEAARAADPAAIVETTAAAPAVSATPAPAAPAVDHSARAAEIVDLATRHGMTENASEWIRSKKSADEIRSLILDQLAERDAKAGGNLNRVSAGVDEADKRRAAGENWLLSRAQIVDPSTKQVYRADPANPMRGYTLLEMARSALERGGIRTDGMSKLDLVGRAFTQSTSDFPVLLENAMHKTLQAAYAVTPDTWSRFCKIGSVSDFRAHTRYRGGSIGNLDPINELGEFVNKAIPDGEKASITAGTKGNIVNLSRQAIIDDDLDAFLGMATTLARAAKRTIEADVYALLEAGNTTTKTADNVVLFHSGSHGNVLSTAAAVTVENVEKARNLMAKQKDVSGNDYLDLRPALWVGPVQLGGAARVVTAAEYDPDTSGKLQRPNMVRGLYRDVIDSPRLTDAIWYLFADPTEAPVIEVAFLDGQTEPFLDMEEGFDVDGARWKVRHDYGIAAIDYRGAVRCSA